MDNAHAQTYNSPSPSRFTLIDCFHPVITSQSHPLHPPTLSPLSYSLLNFLFCLLSFTSPPAARLFSIPSPSFAPPPLPHPLISLLPAPYHSHPLSSTFKPSHLPPLPPLFYLFPGLFYYSPSVSISLPLPSVLGVAVKVRLAPWISCRFMMLPSLRNHCDQGQTKTTLQ